MTDKNSPPSALHMQNIIGSVKSIIKTDYTWQLKFISIQLNLI